MVLGLCRALLRDVTEAEDAAQQAFLSAHRALLKGAEPREPAAWLATIARNECWSRISSRMREPLASGEVETVAGTGDPVAEAIRRADLAALWRAIRALPRAQRDALLLREFGGLRYDELAVALAVTEPAVESLLVRARARLRTQLQSAYASLAPLVRFFVTGGAPAIATKAVALGLGAAAVTGGAVVGPSILEHHAPPQRAPASGRQKHIAPVAAVLPVTTIAAASPPPVVVHTLAAVAPAGPRAHDAGHEQRDGSGDSSGDSSGDGSVSGAGSGDGGDRETPTVAVQTTVPVAPQQVFDSRDGDGGRDGGSDGGSSGGGGPSTTTVEGDGGGGGD